MRKSQKFSVRGALNANTAGSASVPVKFRKLLNCLADRRIGAVLKRGGSITQTPAASLGVPLGMGQHLGAASGSLVPVTRSLLVHFSGTFQKYVSGVWSSVTKDSNVTMDTALQTSMAQIGDNLFIAGGDPSLWKGSGDVEPVGIPAPSSAPTVADGGAGAVAAGVYRHMYTFYNSATGLESDWSPLSSGITLAASRRMTVTTTTTPPAADADKKRIYRTQAGGSVYYLVGTIDIATATFDDNTLDANLGAQAPTYLDNSLPPTTSYITATFASRAWWVDAADPYRLAWSKPYLGNDNNTQYYPPANTNYFDEPITGLLVIPAPQVSGSRVAGTMLIFHPRAVSKVDLSTSGTLTFDKYLAGVGTLFHHSLATNGDDILALGEQGIVNIKGGQKVHISREIDEELQVLLNSNYSQRLYVSCCWSPSLRQFLFLFTAQITGTALWGDISSGAVAEWGDAATSGVSEWEPFPTSGEDITYVKLWGWSPELSSGMDNWWQEYMFAQFPNLTSLTAPKYPTFLFHPMPSSDTIDLQQDATYIGYHNGTEGKILLAFKRDYSLDDGEPIDSCLITGRCVPGEDNGRFKRVTHLQFEGDYADPTSASTTIKYLKDFDDPEIRDYSANLKSFSNDGDMKCLEDGKLKSMNLYIRDTSGESGKILLQDFTLFYRDHHHRESR